MPMSFALQYFVQKISRPIRGPLCAAEYLEPLGGRLRFTAKMILLDEAQEKYMQRTVMDQPAKRHSKMGKRVMGNSVREVVQ